MVEEKAKDSPSLGLNSNHQESEWSDTETSVLDIDYSIVDNNTLLAPPLSPPRKGPIGRIHALGDLHGWTPGLITYLVHNGLASIEINGKSMGSFQSVDESNLREIFGHNSAMSTRNRPNAGLAHRPGFSDIINGSGHFGIVARWIAPDDVGFVQIGDVFDRADHSELGAEILRQLILDAPNRVFVLLGNHEQFMIEGDKESWFMNEIRNAVVDHRDTKDQWEGKHLRFLSTLEQDTDDRSNSVFQAYSQSVFLLYMTQAAAQQQSLGIDRGLSKSDLEVILSDGWKPYLGINEISYRYEKTGEVYPGAIVALVIGDTLFHHAEPDPRGLSILIDSMEKTEFGFSYMDYIHGGGELQKSSHSPLLWARGASTGASRGNPVVESHLEEISQAWPGLFRIVHGHTPTTQISDFSRIKGLQSTTVSYAAQPNSSPSFGIARKIRVYDIDESISPVYFEGNNVQDPTRIPTGLRIVPSSSKQLNEFVIKHSSNDQILSNQSEIRDVSVDSRKLWIWKEGEIRKNIDPSWETTSLGFSRSTEIFNSEWIVNVNETGHRLLNRSLSGYHVLPNLISKNLNEVNKKPKHYKIQPDKTIVTRLSVDDRKTFPLAPMNNPHQSHRASKNIGMIAYTVIRGGQKKGTDQLIVINARLDEINLLISNSVGEVLFELEIPKQTICTGDIPRFPGQIALTISLVSTDNNEISKSVSSTFDFWIKGSLLTENTSKIPLFGIYNSSEKPGKTDLSLVPFEKPKNIEKKEKDKQELDIRKSKDVPSKTDVQIISLKSDIRSNRKPIKNDYDYESKPASKTSKSIDIRDTPQKPTPNYQSQDSDKKPKQHNLDIRADTSKSKSTPPSIKKKESSELSRLSSDGKSNNLSEEKQTKTQQKDKITDQYVVDSSESGKFKIIFYSEFFIQNVKEWKKWREITLTVERVSKHAIMLDLAWKCKVSKNRDEFQSSSEMFSLFQSKKPNADGIIFTERSKPNKTIEKKLILNWTELKKIIENKKFNSIIFNEIDR